MYSLIAFIAAFSVSLFVNMLDNKTHSTKKTYSEAAAWASIAGILAVLFFNLFSMIGG